ncbi:flagellar FlbD family protein [Oribacterium sp. HCP28S3_H8]|jgi:flagellar protein FlbD|uniref:flagellar FlbD family protein n=1 Tax=Oribacterium sp. HCP28S3_H8 TaxID=3438945 RepID=UPI003F8BDA31
MIHLTRLNGAPLIVNYLQVLFIEQIPETKIKLANGDYYLVKDSVESIERQVQQLFHDILTFQDKVRKE